MKKSSRFLVGALTALFACGAYATPIMKWQVEVFTRFDLTTVNPGGVTNNGVLELVWGTPAVALPSGLKITDSPSTTDIETNGAAVPNVSLTHINNPIFDTTLDSVIILSSVTLTPYNPFSPTNLLSNPPFLPVGPATITFEVDFQETPNNDNPCADGGTNGSGVNVKGCADIFVVDQTGQDFEFDYPDPDTFIPRTYSVSFFEKTGGIMDLPSAACFAATGDTSPCIGLETQEEASTTIQFAARITTVPEPTTVLLMGLGLAGLGFARRRRLNG